MEWNDCAWNGKVCAIIYIEWNYCACRLDFSLDFRFQLPLSPTWLHTKPHFNPPANISVHISNHISVHFRDHINNTEQRVDVIIRCKSLFKSKKLTFLQKTTKFMYRFWGYLCIKRVKMYIKGLNLCTPKLHLL